MENLINETIKPAISFLNEIKPKDKVAIIYGHDNDSVCSAAIIHKLLKDFHNIDAKLIISGLNTEVTENVLKDVGRLKPNRIIIVDISTINVNFLTELRNISQVMIVDHHSPKGYVKITYVNPRVYNKESYIPATYLCYKIYENYLDVKEILWIAGIGTLSDMGLKNCSDLFESIKQNFNELVNDYENIDEILFDNSLLGKLAKMFNSARVVKGIHGSTTALNVLIKSKDYQEILKGKSIGAKKLLGYYSLAEKEFNRLVKDFEKKKKQIKNLVLYGVKSKYNMKSVLATYLSEKMGGKVLVIYQKSGRYVDVSFRRGKECSTDLTKLSIKSVEKIPNSNAGGHIQASGARFPTKYTNSWIKSLKEALSK